MKEKEVVIIGYSGHSYVAIDILHLMRKVVNSYLDIEEKKHNPHKLKYKGSEKDNMTFLKDKNAFVSIGDNKIRANTINVLRSSNVSLINAFHPSAYISRYATLGNNVMVAAAAVINSMAVLADGVIVNTGAIVEHECQLEECVHIAPGAVLSGNVHVGERTFVGAGSVVKQGVKIGKDVVIGAGTVVIKDIPDNVVIVGNPQRIL